MAGVKGLPDLDALKASDKLADTTITESEAEIKQIADQVKDVESMLKDVENIEDED